MVGHSEEWHKRVNFNCKVYWDGGIDAPHFHHFILRMRIKMTIKEFRSLSKKERHELAGISKCDICSKELDRELTEIQRLENKIV